MVMYSKCDPPAMSLNKRQAYIMQIWKQPECSNGGGRSRVLQWWGKVQSAPVVREGPECSSNGGRSRVLQ